tara:strand:+ start:1517 stop:1891 length:375 start_codon:yes stop_codon:yes gene_type:complete
LQKIEKKIEKNFSITALVLVISMIIFGISWEIWLNPIRPGGSMLWAKVLPLMLALPGLYKARIYTFQWLSLLVWLYVCEALVRVYTTQKIEILLSVIWLLMSLSLFIIIWRSIRSIKIRNSLTK